MRMIVDLLAAFSAYLTEAGRVKNLPVSSCIKLNPAHPTRARMGRFPPQAVKTV